MEETTDGAKEPKGPNAWLARACGLITMFCVVIPAVFWSGGVLDEETVHSIINYADDRTVLQKVFNPRLNDYNLYQARELSYLFDYLDARCFLFLLENFAITLFIPLSAVVSTVLIILVYRRGVRQTLPGLDRVTAELLLLPFLTCYVIVSSMGLFYRSSKPMLAPVLLALMFQILRTAQSRARGSGVGGRWTLVTRQSPVTFGLLLVAALLDRQGFFYVLSACSLLLVHYLITRRLKDLLVASVAAAIVAHVYNVLLGPAIIWAINAQRPDFTYQQIPADAWAKLPVHCLQAGRIMIANLAAMAGGGRLPGYLVLAVVAAWLVWKATAFYKSSEPVRRWEHCKSGQSPAILYALMTVALHVVMFGVMITRHPYVYNWVDHWYCYYPLPFLVTTLFGLALLLNAMLPRLRTVQRRILSAALVLIAVSNLVHLPAYRSISTSAPWFGSIYMPSENLKASIRHLYPNPALEGNISSDTRTAPISQRFPDTIRAEREFERLFIFLEQRRKSTI